ncbi:YHYH domain-containing protein [Patescibacteria group bacterium]
MNKVKWAIVMLMFFVFAPSVFAHPDRTDSSGCHTCRTNCSSWGLSSGQYHCHNAKAKPQPKEPIKSTYGANGTGTTAPAPEYKKPTAPTKSAAPAEPVAPTCSINSSYNSTSEKCECESGHKKSGDDCVTEEKYCKNSIGENSEYDSEEEKCKCSEGHEFEDSKCELKKEEVVEEVSGDDSSESNEVVEESDQEVQGVQDSVEEEKEVENTQQEQKRETNWFRVLMGPLFGFLLYIFN